MYQYYDFGTNLEQRRRMMADPFMADSTAKGEMMNCIHCGNLMTETLTTFTSVNRGEVYMVENVPCLECPVCEHISFKQDVARTLGRYSSGRLLPVRQARKVWVFDWGDPVVEIPKS